MDAGVLVLSSLRLMYIALDAGTSVTTASIIAEFHDHIEPYYERMYSHPMRGESDEGFLRCFALLKVPWICTSLLTLLVMHACRFSAS